MAKGKRGRGSQGQGMGQDRDRLVPIEEVPAPCLEALSAAPVVHRPMEVLLNGGKPIMDNGTIGVEFFFDDETAAKRPTHVLMLDVCSSGNAGHKRKIMAI